MADRTPVMANRVFATFRLMYEWAHKDRQEHLGVTGHPLAGMDKVWRGFRVLGRLFAR
jgi:hypothetical protein